MPEMTLQELSYQFEGDALVLTLRARGARPGGVDMFDGLSYYGGKPQPEPKPFPYPGWEQEALAGLAALIARAQATP